VQVFPFPVAKNQFQPGTKVPLALSVHVYGYWPSIFQKKTPAISK
jgi:hypothetical protein